MENAVKLISLTTGVSKRTNKPYFHALFKKLGDSEHDEQLMDKWLDENVGSKAVALGLVELTKRAEPEVQLGYGFGGSITSIELVEGAIDFD